MEHLSLLELPKDKDFVRKKRNYCRVFAVSHLSAFRPHYKKGETLGKIRKTEEGWVKTTDIWRRVSEHCLVEGIFADILCEKLRVNPEERKKIVKAALLHDWFKKHEVTGMNSLIKEGKMTLHALEEIKNRDSQALRDMGVADDIIQLIETIVPETIEGPQTLSEKIIWYTDMILFGTEPVSIEQRLNNFERGWDETKEDPARAQCNQNWSNTYREKYDGRSLIEVQRSIGRRLEKELSQRIGYQGDSDRLLFYLKEKFIERVSKHLKGR